MNEIRKLRDKVRRENEARSRAHREYWVFKKCSALVKKGRETVPCAAPAPVEIGGKLYCKHHVPVKAKRKK